MAKLEKGTTYVVSREQPQEPELEVNRRPIGFIQEGSASVPAKKKTVHKIGFVQENKAAETSKLESNNILNYSNLEAITFQDMEERGSPYEPLLQEKALEYLKTHDGDYFSREFTGELDGDGHLIPKDGGKPITKPSMNIGGGFAMKEVEDMVKSEIKARINEELHANVAPAKAPREQVPDIAKITDDEVESDIPPAKANLDEQIAKPDDVPMERTNPIKVGDVVNYKDPQYNQAQWELEGYNMQTGKARLRAEIVRNNEQRTAYLEVSQDDLYAQNPSYRRPNEGKPMEAIQEEVDSGQEEQQTQEKTYDTDYGTITGSELKASTEAYRQRKAEEFEASKQETQAKVEDSQDRVAELREKIGQLAERQQREMELTGGDLEKQKQVNKKYEKFQKVQERAIRGEQVIQKATKTSGFLGRWFKRLFGV